MRISTLPFEFKPFATLCLIIASLGLVLLGTWQLTRRQEKMNLIVDIEQSISNPPKAINSSNFSAVDFNNLPNYSKIQLEGKLLKDESIFLYGRRSYHADKDGYYLLTPLLLADGSKILLMQGWLSHKHRHNILANTPEQDETVKIIGITMPGEKKGFFAPDNDIKNNIWFNIDLPEAQTLNKTNVTKFYLLSANKEQAELMNLLPLNTNNLSKIRNDHLEYAITWFALLVAMWVIAAIKSYNRSKP